MVNINIANEWFDIAEKGLSSAKFLLDMHPIPLEIICYHCQQSSEKFFKGFLKGLWQEDNGVLHIKLKDPIIYCKAYVLLYFWKIF